MNLSHIQHGLLFRIGDACFIVIFGELVFSHHETQAFGLK